MRELAEAMCAKGIEPTSTLVLARLAKGSPNTVVDELRRWRAERGVQPSRPVGADTSPPVPSAAPAVPAVDVAPLAQMLDQLGPLAGSIEKSMLGLGLLTSQISELNVAVQRLDGVRILTLKQIDEARGLARYWEEEARRLRDEGREQEQAYRMAMYSARAESDTLRGQVEELRRIVATLQLGGNTSVQRERGRVATLQLEATVTPTPAPVAGSVAWTEQRAQTAVPSPPPSSFANYDPDGTAE